MKIKNLTYLSVVIVLLLFGCTKKNPSAPSDLFTASATPTPVVPVNLILIDHCEHAANVPNNLNGYWYVYDDNDAPNNGTSVVSPKPFAMTNAAGEGALGSDGYVKITGTVTTAYENGFIGVGTGLGGITDLTQYQGIRFYIRGDGGSYRLSLKSTIIGDSDYFGTTVSTTSAWTEVFLPFTSTVFKQQNFGAVQDFTLALANVTDLQWQSMGQPRASVTLEIDELYFYK